MRRLITWVFQILLFQHITAHTVGRCLVVHVNATPEILRDTAPLSLRLHDHFSSTCLRKAAEHSNVFSSVGRQMSSCEM